MFKQKFIIHHYFPVIFNANLSATSYINSTVNLYDDLSGGLFPVAKIARSFVINPDSTVSMIAYSRSKANYYNSGCSSFLPLCHNPLVHA